MLTRRDNAARNNQVAITTVIDGKETTITQSGILVTKVSPFTPSFSLTLACMTQGRENQMLSPGPRSPSSALSLLQSRFSTLADGQVSTITSIVAIPNVTVSSLLCQNIEHCPSCLFDASRDVVTSAGFGHERRSCADR